MASACTQAQAFLDRIHKVSHIAEADHHHALQEVLQISIDDEANLRRLWAQDPNNPLLRNPFVGLINIFQAPPDLRRNICIRNVLRGDMENQYVMPLEALDTNGPCMVSELAKFNYNWSIFSEGSLSRLTNWDNIIVAGGSVLACLMPPPNGALRTKKATRTYYHLTAYPTSDIDIFLWGLSSQEAEEKIKIVYKAVKAAIPFRLICVRTKNTISFHSQYPYRSVQIILRLYSSPAEILAGFDIDAACCAYDGRQVWASPRAIIAIMRRCITIDMSRRSPSYEVRLAKYASRGFEVYVSGLERHRIDPTIYQGGVTHTNGLARLLILEHLQDPLNPHAMIYRMSRKYPSALKGNVNIPEEFEANGYQVPSFSIPYGPGWDARKIETLVWRNNITLNSPYNPRNKNRLLHRHIAFVRNTVEECMEDCCVWCPDPENTAERELQQEEDKKYVRGRIAFICENPGRQIMTGSFNPIDDEEWSEQAYIGTSTEFFKEIINGDRNNVAAMIESNDTIINRPDRIGRTPLQVAILANQGDIACDLIKAGAEIGCRMADGRTALHCAAEMNSEEVIFNLLAVAQANRGQCDGKSKLDIFCVRN
ncbi:hypothetical protein VKT23_019194 [Stygiomarasmius scandens]|uniref:Ankyrin n=1 Tax=Marasmiellus scandens TaxID=2682957 RepID=A0ABR1IRG9_9AGAR